MPDRYCAHPVFGLCRYVQGRGFVRVDPKHYAVSDDYEQNKAEAARLNAGIKNPAMTEEEDEALEEWLTRIPA